jgi:hypothetical protein
MQTSNDSIRSHHAFRTRDRLVLWLTTLLSVAALLVAGALGAAVRTGGTGQHFAFGEIEDFGSIVVHGVHYDESQANIIVDGAPNQSRAALKLGMMVEIEGEFNYTLGTGTAAVVRANRAILGQVQSINAANGEMQVLSQRVAADLSTRLGGIASLSQIAAGDWVAIHGLNDPARNLFAATLIESITPPAPALSEIRGIVRNARDDRFRIGGLDVTSKTIRVENDDFVAVKGIFDTKTASLLATEISVTPEVEIHEQEENEIEGFIADFRSSRNFSVAGVAINAGAASYSGGTASDLKPGVRITVEGVVINGVLVAEEIKFHASEVKSSDSSGSSIEVSGIVSEFRSIGDFVVKGRRIDASDASISKSDDRLPAVGQKAKVKGKLRSDGRIIAIKVEFEAN